MLKTTVLKYGCGRVLHHRHGPPPWRRCRDRRVRPLLGIGKPVPGKRDGYTDANWDQPRERQIKKVANITGHHACLGPTYFASAALVGGMLLLTACGGGGGGSAVTVPVPADVFPTSGNYAYALKAGGSTTNPTVGLSLIHPLERSAEYQIETVSANLTDVKLIYSGTVSPATQSVSGVLPTALLYITGGDAKRLPLLANGNSPKTNVQAAGATGLCKITLEANDYAAPFDSKYMATTKGPDGLCGTADDGQARIEFTATGKPVVSTSFPEGPLLGIFRELETLKPNSEIYGARIRDNSPSHPLLCIMGVDTTASMTKVVSQAPDVVVAERYGKLVVWTNACRETELNAAVTAGTGWETIGFDATDFYVYQNSGKTKSLRF